MKRHDSIAKYMVAYLPDENSDKYEDGQTVRYIYDQKLYLMCTCAGEPDERWPWMLGREGGYCASNDEVVVQGLFLCSQDFKIGDTIYGHIGKLGVIKEIHENGDIVFKSCMSHYDPITDEVDQFPLTHALYRDVKMKIFKVKGQIDIDILDKPNSPEKKKYYHMDNVNKRDFIKQPNGTYKPK